MRRTILCYYSPISISYPLLIVKGNALTDVSFHVLLILTESDLHGYCEGCGKQAVPDPHEARGIWPTWNESLHKVRAIPKPCSVVYCMCWSAYFSGWLAPTDFTYIQCVHSFLWIKCIACSYKVNYQIWLSGHNSNISWLDALNSVLGMVWCAPCCRWDETLAVYVCTYSSPDASQGGWNIHYFEYLNIVRSFSVLFSFCSAMCFMKAECEWLHPKSCPSLPGSQCLSPVSSAAEEQPHVPTTSEDLQQNSGEREREIRTCILFYGPHNVL